MRPACKAAESHILSPAKPSCYGAAKVITGTGSARLIIDQYGAVSMAKAVSSPAELRSAAEQAVFTMEVLCHDS